jgi:5'-nucleotidase
MKDKLHVLLTNDDGIHASGMFFLWKALKEKVKISIVAPSSEKSGSGLATSLKKPLHIHTIKWHDETTKAWSVNGTPADCVKLANSTILEEKPDIILSGINRGANSGRNVLYSGTVGGIMEGVLRGIPGIAFSCIDFETPNYHMFEKYIYPIVEHFIDHPIPNGTMININFPDAQNPIKGIRFARQGKSYFTENLDKRVNPMGTPYIWLGGRWIDFEEHENSDIAFLKQGYISAVPINVNDMTHHEMIEKHKNTFEEKLSKHFNN